MRIVIFTSNSDGGITQLVYTLAHNIEKMGNDVITFFPNGCETKTKKTRYYNYCNSIMVNNKKYKIISSKILEVKPDLIIMADDAITASSVAYWTSRRIKTVLCIHDVSPHVTKNMFRYVKRSIRMHSIKKSYNTVQNVICFSENEMKKLRELYPIAYSKACLLKLGAHLVTKVEKKPIELECENYALFFGRIDYYKGLDILLQEYIKNFKEDCFKLVVAGKGLINQELVDQAKKKGVILINRFISNEEMNYLVSHSKTVVLPYRDASQSGVLPISYHYEVPVVVSNLPGLISGVIDYKTGRIFKTPDELIDCIQWTIQNSDNLKENICSYYETEYNWKKNIEKVIMWLERN